MSEIMAFEFKVRLDARFQHTILHCGAILTRWNHSGVRFEEIEKFLLKLHRVMMSRQKILISALNPNNFEEIIQFLNTEKSFLVKKS
jgi:hypothetical protein